MSSKVHPTATPRKRNITLRYGVASALEANRLVSSCTNTTTAAKKKLRRLPHIFAKVLELPFRSNADVFIREDTNSFRFSAVTDSIGVGDDVHAHTIEVHPGITKVVIRGGSEVFNCCFDGVEVELELDLWRFRLPDCTVPEMAVAQYADGELVVVVPKGFREVPVQSPTMQHSAKVFSLKLRLIYLRSSFPCGKKLFSIPGFQVSTLFLVWLCNTYGVLIAIICLVGMLCLCLLFNPNDPRRESRVAT